MLSDTPPGARAPAGSYIVPVGLLTVAAVCFVVAASMNATFSASLAADTLGQWHGRVASAAIDFGVLILAAAIGLLCRAKARVLAGVVAVAFVGLTAYSMAQTVGYQAANRIAVAAARASNASGLDKAEGRLAQERHALVSQLLRDARTLPKTERAPYIAEAAKAAGQTPTVLKRSAEDVMPDAQATALGRIAGLSSEVVALAMSVGLAVGLILLKSIGCMLGAYLWPRRAPAPTAGAVLKPSAVAAKAPAPDHDEQPPGGAPPGPEPVRQPSASPGSRPAFSRPPLTLHCDSVGQWFVDRPPMASAEPIETKILLASYRMWCQGKGVTPVDHTTFAVRLAELGAARCRPGNRGPVRYRLPDLTHLMPVPGAGRYAGAAA